MAALDYSVPEEMSGGDAAVNAVARALLGIRNTCEADAGMGVPLVVYCADGEYRPYGGGGAVKESVTAYDRQRADADRVARQAHVAASRRLIEHLQAEAAGLRVLDVGGVGLAAMGRLVSTHVPTHVLVLPPYGWDLGTEDVAAEAEQPAVLLRAPDANVLTELGVRDDYVDYAGCYFGTTVLALLLRHVRRTAQVAVLDTRLHFTDALRAELSDRAYLAPLRAATALAASEVEVVRLAQTPRADDAPPLLRAAEDMAAAVVRAVNGKGPARFRFHQPDGAAVPSELTRLATGGWFAAGSTGSVADGRGSEWRALSDEEVRAPWEPVLHEARRLGDREGFRPFGQWVRWDDVFEDVERVDYEDAFRSAPATNAPPLPVPVLTERDYEAIRDRVWDGTFSDVCYFVGRGVPADYTLRAGDVVQPLVFGGTPRTTITVLGEEHAGATLGSDLSGSRVRATYAHARAFVLDFLRSEAATHWFRRSHAQPEDASAATYAKWALPVPSRSTSLAYASAVRLEEQLREKADALRAERVGVMRVRPEGIGWSRLHRLAAEVRVLSPVLGDVGSLDFRVRAAFPTPLALAYREQQLACEAGDRLDLGLRLLENCAAYAAALRLIQLERDGVLAGSKARRVLFKRPENGFTFGSWLHVLRIEAEADAGGGPRSPLAEDLARVAADRAAREAWDAARELRNRVAHHQVSNAEVRQASDDVDAMLHAVLAGMEPLAAYDLTFVEAAENDPRSGRCRRYRARVLSGDHPLGALREGSAPARLEAGELYLRVADEQWTPCSPFLVRDRAASAPAPDIGVLASFDSQGAKYRRLVGSGSFSDAAAAEQIKEL